MTDGTNEHSATHLNKRHLVGAFFRLDGGNSLSIYGGVKVDANHVILTGEGELYDNHGRCSQRRVRARVDSRTNWRDLSRGTGKVVEIWKAGDKYNKLINGWFILEAFRLYTEYTAFPVACGWAEAVIKNIRIGAVIQ